MTVDDIKTIFINSINDDVIRIKELKRNHNLRPISQTRVIKAKYTIYGNYWKNKRHRAIS